MLNAIGCCVVLAGVILYKFIHYLEKKHAEADHIAVPTFDKEDRNERGRVGYHTEQPFSKLDSGEDLNKFLDESSGRYSDHLDGVEMRRVKPPLRSRSSFEHANGQGQAEELLIV